jgi:cytoskeletal protein CcmA (bactofilin family)|tara:strand:- start:751 stop:1248 length:498 start_codon:yes stop_codon:yes gene_type:complete
MIGSLKRSAGTQATHSDNGINRIVEGTVIEGTIQSDSNLRIDGKFSGELTTKGRLVVGPKGVVKGVINCLCCDVEGILEGEVTVLELLAMKSSATVQGDLFYGQLSVEAGAKALGTFRMGVPKNKKKIEEKAASKADAMASLKSSRIPSEADVVSHKKQTVGAGT